ncbi:MAG TPA: ParB N-terminal domain-containing protein [Tepidisphaeraceae bacterium]|jgi:ParB family chromosome partitioning protein|nr:ParB N-terminal domain-containing protein [Tepidisphaeraceae bacterium]
MTKSSSTNERLRDDGDDGPRIVKIPLDRIKIRDRRESNDDAINDLAVSMRDIGQLNPISVAVAGEDKKGEKTYFVYGGTNRCKAAKVIGWEWMNAIVLKGDDDELRLCEISENLFRNDPTVLESAELITEYVEIVNQKGGQIAHPGGQQPHDKGISHAAKKLHINRERVRRAKQIAAISKDAKAAIKEAKLSNSQKYLLEIAKTEKPDDQVKRVAEIVERKKPKKRNQTESTASDEELEPEALAIHQRDGDFEHLKHVWAKSPEFVEAWTEASMLARDLFIEKVLRQVSSKAPTKADGDE